VKRAFWFLVLGLGVGLVVGFLTGALTAPITLVLQPSLESPLAPAEPPAAPLPEEPFVMSPDEKASFDTRWQSAPEPVRALARIIAHGGVPDAAALAALGPEALSRGYPAPSLDFTRDGQPVPYLATLLQEAVMAYNLPSAQSLIAQGADPRINHSEALFMAIERRTPGAPNFMLFPDHDASLPLVRALLQAGADPNARRHGFRHETPLLLAQGSSNLGALILLVQLGGDPWLRSQYPDGTPTDSLMESLEFSVASLATAEVLFRLFKDTPLGPGTADDTDRFFAMMESAIDKFAVGTGPETRHTAWRFDQILVLAGGALDRPQEAERLRGLLASFDYQADGGWYLARDEIHSRYDAPLSLPDKGDHVWGP
jgi:hypothetical protein